MRSLIREHRRIFILSILIGLAIVESFFAAQIIFVLQEFKLQYVVVPTLLGITVGFLLGSVLALRRQLGKQADIFHAIAEQAFEFSFYRRSDGSFVYVSPAVERLSGYPPAAFYENPQLLRQIIHPEDQPTWDSHLHEVDDQGIHNPLLIRIIGKDGATRWIHHICSKVEDEQGNLVGVRSTNADVTDDVLNRQKLNHLANYDPLTDLPNRRRLTQHIEQLITDAGDRDNAVFGVLFVDLDRFKYINDTYGHTFGDRFLRLIAKRLIRNCDKSTLVSRFGGDEFVVITPMLKQPEDAMQYAERLVELLQRSLEIKGRTLYVSASVGISLYPYDGEDADTLIKHADAAMFLSKKDGSNAIRYASSQLVSQASKVLTLETRLRNAIDRDELLLYYQPKVRMPERKVIGFEALARWQEEGGQLVPPSDFIPFAEETGLIVPIAERLMEKLRQQVSGWVEKDLGYKVAFNLSPRQFGNTSCCRHLVSGWSEAGLPPNILEIEITESLLLDNLDQVLEQLEYLREQGVSISLDDFGTGFSSLSYLRNLPIDNLKIDRAFVSNLLASRRDRGIIEAVITLAKNFGMEVIAEGVEEEAQVEMLYQMGCRQFQGYYFSKPVPYELVANQITTIDSQSLLLNG
jgi:diguanylate cyclase (GGDEF)-like protein/PAS domain S-box-containing protein